MQQNEEFPTGQTTSAAYASIQPSQPGELPPGQTSSRTYDSIQPPQPDVVYGDIIQSQDPDLGNNQLYANVPTNNDREVDDPVLYSELLSKNDNHAVAPSGDLYAQVQKR